MQVITAKGGKAMVRKMWGIGILLAVAFLLPNVFGNIFLYDDFDDNNYT